MKPPAPKTNSIDEILTRNNRLHGIQHNILGGKNLAFEYCAYCKDAKQAIQQLITEARLRDFETMLNCHKTWSKEACTEWLEETISELRNQLSKEG